LQKSGHALLLPEAIDSLKKNLIPLATVLTPNLPEAQALVGNFNNSIAQGEALLDLGAQSIFLKGGHATGATSDDLFLDNKGARLWTKDARIDSQNTHGTGCTLSAAICAFIAQGEDQLQACIKAKTYLHGAIRAAQFCSVGKGQGPVDHFYSF